MLLKVIILLTDIFSIYYAIKNRDNTIIKWSVIIYNILSIFIIYYNVLVTKRNKVKNAYSSLDVMFKKRNDLIPNLVNCVKGYMNYEETCLKNVISLRKSFNSSKDKFSDNNQITSDLNKFLVLTENYPDLKTDEQFLKLEKSLYDMEEMISAGRRTYNAHVTSFNTFIELFPNLLFAKFFGFKKFDLFKVEKILRERKIYYENQR